MVDEKISSFEMSLVFFSGIGIYNHVIVIHHLLQAAGRDAWISILFSLLISIVWVFILYFLIQRKNEKGLFEWLRNRFGNLVSFLLVLLLMVYFIINVLITLKEMVFWMKMTFMPQTPQWILTFLFLAICTYTSISGIRTLAIVNGILLPAVIVFGFLVGIGNIPNKDYSLLFPILVNGPSQVVKGIVFPLTGYLEMFLFLILGHRLKTKVTLKNLMFLTFGLTILVLGPTTGAIAEFGPFEAARLRFPAFEEWSLLNLGRFIEHVDFFSIYQWLSGALIRISLYIYAMSQLMPPNLAIMKRKRLMMVLYLIIFIVMLFPISDMEFTDYTFQYYFILSIIMIMVIVCFIFVGVWIKPDREEV